MTVGIIGNRKIGETVIWNLSGLGCKILPKGIQKEKMKYESGNCNRFFKRKLKLHGSWLCHC